jgi:asparagine synthase (glutamine-hydrolysing)
VTFSGYLDPLPAGHRGEADFVLARYQAADWTWLREASGVFSFAIVDHGRGRAVLATDRLGIRPLFFAHDGIGTAFASDLSALAPWRPRPPEIDHDALQEQMAWAFRSAAHVWRHVGGCPEPARDGAGLRTSIGTGHWRTCRQ